MFEFAARGLEAKCTSVGPTAQILYVSGLAMAFFSSFSLSSCRHDQGVGPGDITHYGRGWAILHSRVGNGSSH